MNQDIKDKWVAALRSGESGTEWKNGYYNDSESFLSKNIMEWSDLKQKNPRLHYNTPCNVSNLSSLNDNGFTFLQIADLIEAQL
jgi:hypothetical protein